MATHARRTPSRARIIAPAVFSALALLLTTGPLAAETSLVMTSEPGDYIGGGQSHYYDTSTGTFSANTVSSHQYAEIYYNGGSHWWNLDFAALSGDVLAPGTYIGATRFPFQQSSEPGLSVSGDGRGCNQLTGDFRVRAVTFVGPNSVGSLWAEFEQHCEGGPAALRGEIRFNVTPLLICRAPLVVSVTVGQTASFAVTASHPGSPTPVQLIAHDVPAGASFGPAGPDSAAFAWQPGASALGVHLVSFVAVDSLGARDSVTTVIRVEGEQSLWTVSEAGDPVGGGQSRLIGPDQFNIDVRREAGSLAANFNQTSSPYETWWLNFVAPGDVAPGPGVYDDAVGYPGPGNTLPEMRAVRNSSFCQTIRGEFQVKIADYGVGDRVDQCWVRFAQRCSNGSGWLSGELRWNVAPPVAVRVPMRATARAGAMLHLGIGGFADGGGPVTFTGVDLPAGAAVVPAGSDSATLEWTPAFAATGEHTFVIVGTNTGAETDSAIVTVEVTGESHFTAVSDSGDPVGNGQSYDFESTEAAFTGILSGANGVTVSMDIPNTFEDWSFSFAVPGAGPVAPGTYLDATAFPGSGTTPGLNVYRNYSYCQTISGDFRIRQVEAVPGVSLQRFRAEFEQRCGNTNAALRGEIRFNVNVPLDLRAPIRKLASRGFTATFPVTAISATGDSVTLAAGVLPAASFSATGGAGTFSWTPGLGQTGLHPVTFVASATDGSLDSVVTWIEVTGVNALSIASEVGDPVGGGLSYHYGPDAATFFGTAFGGTAVVNVQPLPGTPWSVGIAPPAGASLAPGFYFDVASLNSSSNRARLSVGQQFGGCYNSTGRFEIKQIESTPSGELVTLWARFLQRCEAYPAGLTGEIRFNADVRVTVAAPFEIEYEQGQPVSFAIKGTDVLGRPVSLAATGLPPGASFIDHGNDTGDLTWAPTFDQFGRYPIVFHAENPDGDQDSVVTEIVLAGRRLWTLHSDPGDPIGGGIDQRFESDDGVFGLTTQTYDGTVYALFDPTPTGYGGEWSASFRLPFGVPLTPGVYRDAHEPATNSQPRLLVQGPSGFCYERVGQFRVRSVVYDSSGQARSLRVDFDQACEDSTQGLQAPGLHGSIIHRANAYVIVDAPISVAARPGDSLAVEVRGEDAGGAPVTLSAIDLPPGATFADHGDGSGALEWVPQYAHAGLHYPRFLASNGAGASDTVTTEIRVVGITQLTLTSDSGDPVGGGQSDGFTDSDASFRLVRNSDGGVSATVGRDGEPAWQIHFAPRAGTELLPGDYAPVQRYPFQEPSRPGLWATDGPSCSAILGDFTVHHITWGPGNEVASFWATFEQHCNGVTPALHGQLLYNLDVAVPVQVALVSAEARDDRVELRWYAAEHEGEPFALERREDNDAVWHPLAVLHADGSGHVEYADRDVVAGRRYGYRLVVNESGRDRVLGEAWVRMSDAAAFAFDGLRPNPAVADLAVAFTLPRAGRVRVQLLDVAGRAVVDRTLDGLGGGRHLERIAAGGEVPAGVYLVRLEFDGERRTRAAIVVR